MKSLIQHINESMNPLTKMLVDMQDFKHAKIDYDYYCVEFMHKSYNRLFKLSNYNTRQELTDELTEYVNGYVGNKDTLIKCYYK